MGLELDIYAFRHGQTDWNLIKKFQGHTDIPLNAEGLRQAAALAPLFEGVPIEAVVSSDLSRAAKTAEILAAHHKLPVQLDRRLREAHFGSVEGLTRDEVVQRLGADSWERWMSMAPEHMDFRFPGGESKRQFLARIQDFLAEYASKNPQTRTLALSTHGAVMRRLIQSCRNVSTEIQKEIWITNCEVHRLGFDPESKLWTYKAKAFQID